MTDDELDRLDALAQAATPGPWNADDDGTIILAPDDVLSRRQPRRTDARQEGLL